MRLIAMSAHTTLKTKQQATERYVQHLRAIMATLHTPTDNASEKIKKNDLVVIIGAQKGLCGTFNNMLLQYIMYELGKNHFHKKQCIVIGKHIIDALKGYPLSVIETFPVFSPTTIHSIATNISTAMQRFSATSCIYTKMKNFFIHEPQTILLTIPNEKLQKTPHNRDSYLWEIPIDQLYADLLPHYHEAHITALLTQSLLAEQAARFVAMDNATRNARTLLDEKKLEYNKVRQALITKELSELTGIFNT